MTELICLDNNRHYREVIGTVALKAGEAETPVEGTVWDFSSLFAGDVLKTLEM